MEEIHFSYKPPRKLFWLSTFFFLFLAYFFFELAMTNKQGLNIRDGAIVLSEEGATVLYFCLMVFLAAMSLTTMKILWFSYKSDRHVILGKDYVSAPKNGLSQEILRFTFSEIDEIYIDLVQQSKVLFVKGGERELRIPAMMLEDKQSFEDLFRMLQQRLAK